MKMETAHEVMACLPQGKTAFDYFKDKYAVFLLSQAVGKQCAIADLKRSAFAGLLSKPLIKDVVAQSGDGILRQAQLELAWGTMNEPFLLTLDIWGNGNFRYNQISRPGYSLVLQLNFSNKHDEQFKKLAKPDQCHDFNCWRHPVMKRSKRAFFRETLAWARIDFDFNTNEALIEELQTDWLRTAKELLADINSGKASFYGYGVNANPEKLKAYLNYLLSNYSAIWDEALLTAALQFIRQELGIGRIYLHTPDTGAAVKRIKYSQPPRSLYSSLPKRFCFSQTEIAPEFLRNDGTFRRVEKKLGQTRWNVINLGGNHADITQSATEKSGRPITLAA